LVSSSHAGVAPVHAASLSGVHCTHSLSVEHTGAVAGQLSALPGVHSTHAPLLAHTSPVGQSFVEHATQNAPSQIGVVPLHWALPLQAVHAGFPMSFTHCRLTQVWRTPSAQRSAPFSHTQLPLSASHTGVLPPHACACHAPSSQT